MDLARARDAANIVITTTPSVSVTVPYRLLPQRLLCHQLRFKLLGFQSTEVVAFADDVATVRVGGWVHVAQEAEHFCSVAAAAKHDEKTRRSPAFSAVWSCGVRGGEDIEKAELWGCGLVDFCSGLGR